MSSQLTDKLPREVFGDCSTSPVVISYSTSTASTNALSAGVLYRFLATTDCNISFGSAPTAVVATCTPMTAGIPEYWKLNSSLKVAVIARTVGSSGMLYITPMLDVKA